MNLAKRLTKVGVWFRGPHSAELFKVLHVPKRYDRFDHVVIGTGESRAVAASRALSHMRDLNILPILEDIQAYIQVHLTENSFDIEGTALTQIYCIVAVGVEREA